MSLVHLCMPSKRPAAEVYRRMQKWSDQGYHIVLQRDPGEGRGFPYFIHEVIERPYLGYPEAVNFLAARSLTMDPECQWIVCAGDDTDCDMAHTSDEIAAQCIGYFAESPTKGRGDWSAADYRRAGTFGVMQPTGDRWADTQGVIIERIAGSPWLGRSWCARINQGRGPLWPEYFHNWADEELKLVAEKLGVYWMRPDIIHYHEHSMRQPGGQWQEHQQGFSADYVRMKPLFDARKKMNFPGSEPL